MGYSILNMGADTRKQALQGLSDTADRETKRNAQNDQIKTAERTQQMSAVGTGAAIGTMIAPGVGTAIGAAAGFLASELF